MIESASTRGVSRDAARLPGRTLSRVRPEGRALASTRVPLVALAAAALALALELVGGTGAALELRRDSVLSEPWRLVTGHLVHFGFQHFALDVLAFFVLTALCERSGRGATLRVLALSAVSVSAAVLLFCPELTHYRGLSGIDSALFAYLARALWRRPTPGPLILVAQRLPLLLFAGKLSIEALAGTTLFVSPTEDFSPVPIAHIAGGLTGWALARRGSPGRAEAGAGH